MATKLRINKFIKGAPVLDRPPLQRAPVKPTALYLLALRSHAAQTQSLIPRKKLVIETGPGAGEDNLPQPVKITHT